MLHVADNSESIGKHLQNSHLKGFSGLQNKSSEQSVTRGAHTKILFKTSNLNHKVLFSQVFMTEHTSENIFMQRSLENEKKINMFKYRNEDDLSF